MLAGLTATAFAWTEATERTLATQALGETVIAAEGARPADPRAADRIREAIDAWARTSAPAAQSQAWIARYPTPDRFDAWAWKDALGLAPEATVVGIDIAEPQPWDLLGATLAPLRDGRHAPAPARGPDRGVLVLPDGRPIPADPAMFLALDPTLADVSPLEMVGPLQVARGHGERLDAALAGPVEVWWRNVDLAQTFVDLSVLAATDAAPDPASARAYLSQAQHYVLDAADPLRCAECGVHAFSSDAFGGAVSRSLLTGGGYLSPVTPPSKVGFERAMARRAMARGLVDAMIADPASEDGRRLRGAIHDGDIVSHTQLADGLKRAGGPPERTEYADIAATWLAGVVDFDTVRLWRQLAVLESRETTPEAWNELFGEHEAGLRRAGVSMRAIEQHTANLVASAAKSEEDRASVRALVLERLVKRRLDYLAERDVRRADYTNASPPPAPDRVRAPEILAGELIAAALAVALGVGIVFLRRQRAEREGEF